ncbi:hypothetical protein WICPIJ_004595 [Wickerhamomyces pijperi]|uniref:Uncharacterized protein n=1 Tax=Wickerhamomyces pijperi TaxID=599730 RepID=A0A9P8TMQ7_WICPI|nr:hypothetical protein WICPIJ_004595 [Wickerhamomyces pijperi]
MMFPLVSLLHNGVFVVWQLKHSVEGALEDTGLFLFSELDEDDREEITPEVVTGLVNEIGLELEFCDIFCDIFCCWI